MAGVARYRFDTLVNFISYVDVGIVLHYCEMPSYKSFSLAVSTMVHLIKSFLPSIFTRGGSAHLIVSSASSNRGMPDRFVCGTTETAVMGLTGSVAPHSVGYWKRRRWDASRGAIGKIRVCSNYPDD